MVEKTQNDSLSACLLKEQHGNCTQYVTHMQTAFFRGQKQVCEHPYFLYAGLPHAPLQVHCTGTSVLLEKRSKVVAEAYKMKLGRVGGNQNFTLTDLLSVSYCSLLHSIQTGSGAHPASYPMGTGR
jgi:hypothetical protein